MFLFLNEINIHIGYILDASVFRRENKGNDPYLIFLSFSPPKSKHLDWVISSMEPDVFP